MNGFVAAWSTGGDPLDGPLLERMAGALSAPAGARVAAWTDGAFGIAGRWWDPAPPDAGIPAPGGVLLAFDGRLDDHAALVRELEAPPGASDPALVLAAYRRWGAELAARLNGDFAFVLFDPAEQRVLMARDAVGLRPLHFTRLPGLLLVSSEIRPLLRHPRISAAVNPHHLAEFLLGAPPAADGGLTFFAGIEAVAPGHRLLLTREGTRVDRFWDFPETPLRRPRFEAYRDEFRQTFEQAVGRRMRGARPVAVSVSGGVDSSSVYCMAQWLRRERGTAPVEGLTEAHPGDPLADETGYVEEMERWYGVPVHRLPGGGVGDLQSWSRQVAASEIPALHPFATATEDRVRFAGSLGARVLLGGEWADATVFDQTYLVDLARRGHWGSVRTHLRTIPRWFQDADPRPFRDQFLRDLVRLNLPGPLVTVLRRLRRSAGSEAERIFRDAPALRPFLGGPPEDPGAGRGFPSLSGRSIYGRVRARRAALDLGSMAKSAGHAGIRFALPYVDRELLAFLIAVPGEVLAPAGVPKGLLREAMRGRMPESIVERRWKADFTHLVQVGLQRYFVTLAAFLRSHCVAAELGLVDGHALRGALDRWTQRGGGSPPEQFWTILQVLGLELWLQAFLDGRPPQ